MDFSRILRYGDEVRVSAGNINFVSKIFDVTGKSSFTILRQIGVAPPETGDIYLVTCVTEMGMYIIKAEVTGLYDSPAAIGLQSKSEYVKLQRRSTFRAKEFLPVKVFESSDSVSSEWVETTTADISESGMLLRYNRKCVVGSSIRLIVHLNRFGMDVSLPTIKGKVVRCIGTSGEKPGYLVGIEFENLPESARNEIIRFVVLSQRDKMKDPQGKRYRNYG
ncbi:MAG: hypothetical protein EOM54_02300 [Clostridia bacterium]|nr:hypothetical protein [Clostridia bacterium]NCC68575.1 hypothetical protein [Clostridia bacterium]